MIDPVRFKKILIQVLKVLIVLELISAVSQGFSTGDWSRLGFDLLVAGILYIAWDRIRMAVRDKRNSYKTKIESGGENVKVWDAMVFSLLWTDSIYASIPVDRKRLVVISYTLIALGVVAIVGKLNRGTALATAPVAFHHAHAHSLGHEGELFKFVQGGFVEKIHRKSDTDTEER